jgi:hypothetical protein
VNRVGAYASLDDINICVGNLKYAIVKTPEPYKKYMVDSCNKLIEAYNILIELTETYPDLEKEHNDYPELGGL